jgi:chemotaxis response regulator CheB
MGRKGLPVIAQRPSSCAVAGMPQSAIDTGAVHAVLAPEEIAVAVNRWSARRPTISEAAS